MYSKYDQLRRRFCYVVNELEEIQKLVDFTNHPLVRSFAYVKHVMKNSSNTHYHFCFILHGMSTSVRLEKLLGVPKEHEFYGRDSLEAEIDYFLRGGEVDDVVPKTFRTNIKAYKKYNGV